MNSRAFAKAMMEHQPDARPTDCVILGHCRTRVFEFPGTLLVTPKPPQPAAILEGPGAKATVVSDMLDYFHRHTPFRHFRICCALRFKIEAALSKRAENERSGRFPLFLVVEQETPCRRPLEDGLSCIVDQGLMPGGKEGEHVVMAWKVDDAPWPDMDENDTGFINTALAAVKIVQNVTEVIREEAESSCFYDEHDRAVYPVSMVSNARLSKSSPSTDSDLHDILDELRGLTSVLDLERSRNPERIDTLVDALKLERIETEHYRCAWYLSLFEATRAMLPGDAGQRFVDGCAKVRDFGGSPRFCRNRFLSHGTAPVVRPLPCVPSGGSDSVVLQHRTIRA